MLTKAVLVGAYYLVAITTVSLWTVRDFGATRARLSRIGSHGDGLAGSFLWRVSVLFGVASAVGAALVMTLLMSPTPKTWIVAAAVAAEFVVTVLGIQAVVRLLPRIARKDPLQELRPSVALSVIDDSVVARGQVVDPLLPK